jgi:hypothetical protein
MPGPGEYRPDPTAGISRIEDLPKPKIRCQSRNYRRRPCPRCGHSAYRDRLVRRTLHDLGNPLTGRPRDMILIYSQHYCSRCRKYFNADMTDLAAPGSHYTKRVVDTAVRLVIEDGLPYRAASWSLWRDHRVFVPYATIQNWVEDGGEKAQRRIPTDYLDWALSDFSGYIAADELYDGPFCVLSIVDNRTFKRLSYHVLDRDPTQVDVEAFFRRFRQALEARGLCCTSASGFHRQPGKPPLRKAVLEAAGAKARPAQYFDRLRREYAIGAAAVGNDLGGEWELSDSPLELAKRY